MKPSRELEVFTIEEIEKATSIVAYQIPVTFNCDVKFSANYVEKEKAKIACPGCICYVELKSPKESKVIGKFEAVTVGYFNHQIWSTHGDNIIARIVRLKRRITESGKRQSA